MACLTVGKGVLTTRILQVLGSYITLFLKAAGPCRVPFVFVVFALVVIARTPSGVDHAQWPLACVCLSGQCNTLDTLNSPAVQRAAHGKDRGKRRPTASREEACLNEESGTRSIQVCLLHIQCIMLRFMRPCARRQTGKRRALQPAVKIVAKESWLFAHASA